MKQKRPELGTEGFVIDSQKIPFHKEKVKRMRERKLKRGRNRERERMGKRK